MRDGQTGRNFLRISVQRSGELMKIIHQAIIAAGALATSAGAVTINTGVTAVGATHVLITHSQPGSANSYIQIGELQAFKNNGVNVAQASNGGVATGTASFGTNPGQANDGNTSKTFPFIFTTQNGPGEFLRIDFSNPASLTSIVIYGRSDCCVDRDSWTLNVFAGSQSLYSGLVDARDGSIATVNFLAPPPTGGVPEPESWALLIAGLGLTGAALRRRRALPA